MSLPQILIASLEKAFNQYLSLDPQAMQELAAMEGRIIAVEISGFNETLYLFPSADGIMILSDFDAEADTTITGTLLSLAKLGLSEDTGSVLFSGDIGISGDIRLGNQFKKILARVNIDWEEQISKYLGDIGAHQLARAAQDFSQWFSRSLDSLQMDLGEYLQEESRLTPTNAELNRFIKETDHLREGVDRLQARIERLINKIPND
jgi:ubiquinone biosynthesis protein UbiJ